MCASLKSRESGIKSDECGSHSAISILKTKSSVMPDQISVSFIDISGKKC